MKSSRLVVFGDSWPAGVGADNPSRDGFVSLLGAKLNCSVLNLSRPATSINHATWEFINFITTELDPKKYNDKILFCLSGKARSWYFENDQIKELHPMTQDTANLAYYSYLHSEELSNAERIKNIILINSLCEKYSLPLYFVLNWDERPDHPLIDLDKFYSKSLLNLCKLFNRPEEKFTPNFFNNKYMNQFHPNNLGHQLIADALYQWIK